MSIKFVQGDMFSKKYDVMVNTVNCVGVMGKGIALEFKRRYPNNFAAHKRYCELNLLYPGHLFPVVDNDNVLIINAATKEDWKRPSRKEWIERILANFIPIFESLPLGTTVAIPALGCGNGGLNWSEVKIITEKRLRNKTDNVKVDIYEPLPLSQKKRSPR